MKKIKDCHLPLRKSVLNTYVSISTTCDNRTSAQKRSGRLLGNRPAYVNFLAF